MRKLRIVVNSVVAACTVIASIAIGIKWWSGEPADWLVWLFAILFCVVACLDCLCALIEEFVDAEA
jgi:type IV secretory pathway VirB2 component (pilin)